MSTVATQALRVLVVEDGISEREALARFLRAEQFDVRTARNPEEALNFINDRVDIVLSDLRMGKQSGIDLLQSWRARHPDTPFVILTAYGEVGSAVQAMKLGANDFLAKPIDPTQLLEAIRDLVSAKAESEPDADADIDTNRANDVLFEGIVGRSKAMQMVFAQTLRAAKTSSTVLILGESGTGKELFAEAIHRHSARRDQPFVVVNMAAIPDTLVESELFGHVKGAFTGALADRIGRFEAANGGTLFIDEIGDFPLHLQAKLLRVLESRKVNAVGSSQDRSVDVRVVAATSRPLQQMRDQGKFREDLYYRLNVISLQLPPLRQRRQDIPLLVHYFLHEFSRQQAEAGTPCEWTVHPELLRTLQSLDWRGNVRQLRNCLESMTAMASTPELTKSLLPQDLLGPTEPDEAGTESRLDAVKRSAILSALEQFGGNRTRAAEFLGISVRTLQRKLREWDSTEPR